MKTFSFILTIICMNYVLSYSQSDTVNLDDYNKLKEIRNDRYYKLFLADRDREINHFWKFDLISFGLLMPNIGFEQRIGKQFSSNTHISGGFMASYEIIELRCILGVIDFEEYTFGFKGTQEFRYYYNLLHREHLGKRINGFSGNFFALSLSAGFTEISYPNSYFNAGFNYGFQRRIGNIGFIEGYIGILAYTPAYYWCDDKDWAYTFKLSIKAGFAIDSFKNLKRMLK